MEFVSSERACERKREVRDDINTFGLSIWKHGIAIIAMDSENT